MMSGGWRCGGIRPSCRIIPPRDRIIAVFHRVGLGWMPGLCRESKRLLRIRLDDGFRAVVCRFSYEFHFLLQMVSQGPGKDARCVHRQIGGSPVDFPCDHRCGIRTQKALTLREEMQCRTGCWRCMPHLSLRECPRCIGRDRSLAHRTC